MEHHQYDIGRQPCDCLNKTTDGFGSLVMRKCKTCGASTVLCDTCSRWHHWGGWQACRNEHAKPAAQAATLA